MDEFQVATAEKEANSRLSANKLGNNNVYILVVEQFGNVCKFVSTNPKQDWNNSIYVDFTGFEITDYKKQEIEALNSLTKVSEYVKEKNIRIRYIKFPWTKIINIENITYKQAGEK